MRHRAGPASVDLAELPCDGGRLWVGVRAAMTPAGPMDVEQQRALAHTWAREVAAYALGWSPDSVRFERAPSGRPYVVGAPDEFDLSWAHTDGWVAAAAGLGVRCGVDVECCTRADALAAQPDRLARLRARTLADQEQLDYAGRDLHDVAVDMLDRWVVKEAWAKAIGTGLEQDLRALTVNLGIPSSPRAGTHWQRLDVAAPTLPDCGPCQSWRWTGQVRVHAAVVAAPRLTA